ncbi:hypothetical protein WN51_01112 [Melipona quadrifasciata]|uniref:dolichyl-phosphate-mannose--protein mannosyltransferase n=2 Tax=Meliponini TaxID=83319 RepID=A0A0M8ZVZ0_9HYME|nr:hypothetical protein WN51_01112 [Melipona quadrifasciata]
MVRRYSGPTDAMPRNADKLDATPPEIASGSTGHIPGSSSSSCGGGSIDKMVDCCVDLPLGEERRLRLVSESSRSRLDSSSVGLMAATSLTPRRLCCNYQLARLDGVDICMITGKDGKRWKGWIEVDGTGIQIDSTSLSKLILRILSLPEFTERAILTNPDLLSSTPWSRLLENDFWGTPLNDRGSHGSYRPLCVATFRLNHLLGGLEPWGYHLVNVALHAACTVLVVRVARKVLPGRNNLGHAITGFLFAAHPIHSEAVAGVVGRADLLACLLTLTAFLAYSAHCERTRSPFPLLLALVSSTLATLAKETGISSLALCLLWELCRGESSRKVNCSLTRARSIGIVSGSLALLVLGRLRITGTRPEFASADNPTARHPSRLTRGLTFLYLPAASARMLLCPSTLSFDWSMDAVPRITSLLDARNLETACLYTALIGASIWTIRTLRRPPREFTLNLVQQYPRSMSSRCPVCAGRRTGGCHTDGCRAANNNNNGPIGDCYCAKRPNSGLIWSNGYANRQAAASGVAASLGFLVLPFLPASNLFFYVGFVIAERILYLPSVGACLMVGAAISGCYQMARRHGSRRRGRAVLLATAILVCLMSAKTLLRNTDWFDEESLYRSALHVNPPKAYGNLGSVLSAQGRVAEAEEAFVQALRYRPNMADVHYNL